jgi:hypothetical protein
MMQKKDAEGKKIFSDETEKLIRSTEAIFIHIRALPITRSELSLQASLKSCHKEQARV